MFRQLLCRKREKIDTICRFWEIKKEVDTRQQLTLPMLTPDEEKIFTNIQIEGKGVDELLTLTGLKLDDLLMNLTTMELKGIIKQCNGDRYIKV